MSVEDHPEYDDPPSSWQTDEPCPSCEEPMQYINEPMISGFRGHLCDNEDCPRDS